MILPKLAVSFGITVFLIGSMALLTDRRATSREGAALAAHPPTGQFLVVDGARVHVQIAGSGPDLVLIHGASGNLNDFTFDLMDRLVANYRVIAVDRPGLGHSDPLPLGQTSLASQAYHIAKAVSQLGADHPIVLGQSYGGAVALAWALHEPAKPAALVLVSAVSLPWPGKLDPWYRLTSTRIGAAIAIPLAAAFIPKSYIEGAITAVFAPSPVPPGYEVTIGTGLALRRETLRINARQVNELRGQIVVMEPLYADLRLPIELIHGTADTIVPLTVHSAPFADQMPNSVLTIIEGAGHMPHQSHPDLIIAAIDRAAVRAGLR